MERRQHSPDPPEAADATMAIPPQIGVAADHGGFDLKLYLFKLLRAAGHSVVDFGDTRLDPDDDYPDFVVPLAHAVASVVRRN